MTRWKTRGALALVALAFVGMGMLFIPRMGIEVDEALIADGIYPRSEAWYSWTVGGNVIPVMLLSYLGALKTWFYSALFWLTPPRPISLRLPMLIAAAAALCLFFVLLDRTIGRRAAWIGTLLLATDSSYLLLNAIDFGPVALQFLLKMGALVLLLKFYRGGSKGALAGGFFLLGSALWDKAVFVWVLFGLALAVASVFPREVRRFLTPANIGIAAASMLVGALPLVIYNIAQPLETFRSHGQFDAGAVAVKAQSLKATMDGYIFFGFMTRLEPGPQPGVARHWYQSLSIAMNRRLGDPYHNLTVFALLACILAVPLLWRTARKPVLFGAVACVGTWTAMAFTAGGGEAAHHAVLLWPFHFLVISAVVSRARLVPAVAVTALLCGSNLAVTNHYYADLIRNGPGIRWTDAMDPLQQYLRNLDGPRIIAADWGFLETMNLLTKGELITFDADLRSDSTILKAISDPDNVFIRFTPPVAFEPATMAFIQRVAQGENYEQEHITTIYDLSGRPTFDVFRFRKVHL